MPTAPPLRGVRHGCLCSFCFFGVISGVSIKNAGKDRKIAGCEFRRGCRSGPVLFSNNSNNSKISRRILKNQGFQRGHFRIKKLPFDVISKMAPEAFFHPDFQVILKKVENRVGVWNRFGAAIGHSHPGGHGMRQMCPRRQKHARELVTERPERGRQRAL